MTDQPDWDRLNWDRLIEFLNTWASARALGPDLIRVTWDAEDGATRDVEIVMSPDDFSDLTGHIWGEFEPAARQVKESLEQVPVDCTFLVYKTYELHPSRTEELPEDPEMARMRELMRKYPDGIPGGRWVAFDPEGRAHPFPEQPPKD